MKRVPLRLWLVLAIVCFAGILKATLPQITIGNWTATSSLSQARSNGAAVLLNDGRILFTGGDSGSGAVQSAEFFNADGTVSSAGSMNVARSRHFAVVMSDGRVLVGGGNSGGGTTNSAEIYDPSTGNWAATSPMNSARANATAALLQDGRVVIAGGDNAGAASNTVEIFDPSSGSFSVVSGTLSSPRTKHAMAVLQNGQVLIIGGFDGTNPLASTDVFDPSAGTIAAGPALATARYSATATTLLNGQVAVIGGAGSDGNGGITDLASIEIFDPTAGAFSTVSAALATAREGHQAYLLPNNNNVLITGGTSGGTALASSELFTAQGSSADGSWGYSVSATGAMTAARSGASGAANQKNGPYAVVTPMPGLVITGGGADASGNTLASTEAYGYPTVQTDQADYPPGTNVHIQGSGFQPNENVTITLVESPLFDTHGPYTVQADGNGNISDSSFTTDTHDENIRFFLSAAGSQSGLVAQNTFTDGNTTVTGTVTNSTTSAAVSGATVTCTSGCTGTPSTTTAANGTYSLNVNFTGNTGSVTLTATAAGFNSATNGPFAVSNNTAVNGKNFSLTPISATNSTVTTNSATEPDDGVTAATITVTVKDTANTVAAGKTVTLAQGGGSSTISPASATTNSGGVATFTVKDTKAETVTYTATVDSTVTITPTAAVQFTLGPVNAGASKAVASPTSVPADGTSTSTITVTLNDATNNPVSGKSVTLTAGSGSSTITTLNGTTNASGQATFTVKDSVAEVVTYTAKDATDNITVTQTATVTFTAGTVDAGTSTVVANPTSVTANGTSTSTITVTLKDGNSNQVSGKTVSLTAGSGSSTITTVSSTTNASGQATFTVKDSVAEQVTYTAKDATDNITITATATVTFTAGPATKVVFGQQPTNAQAGSAITPAVTVKVEDANNNVVTSSNAPITVAIGTNPGGGTLSGTASVSAVNGVATFSNLSIDKVGTGYTLTASSGALTSATSTAFNITAGTATKLVFGQQPSNALAGSTIAPAITVLIQDQFGNATTSTASVTLAIGTNPSSGTLSGTATVAAIAGTATFNNLSINNAGSGYTLNATSTGLASASSNSFNIDSLIAFSSAAVTEVVGICSPQMIVQRQNAGGTGASLPSSETVAVSANGLGTTFFSDAGCQNALTGNNLTIAANQSSASLFFKNTSATALPFSINITATKNTFATTSTVQTESVIPNISFANPPGTSTVGLCSPTAAKIVAIDETGTTIAPVAPIAVNLATSSPNGAFFSDSACLTPITTTSIPSGNKSGAMPFYKDNTAGTPTLTATAGTATTTTQATVNKATAVFSNLSAPTIAFGVSPTTFSGTVNKSGAVVATGSVTITLAGTAGPISQSATLDANGNFSASIATGTIPAGTYVIQYSYPGDSNFNPPTPNPNVTNSLTVTKATTSTTVASSVNPSVSGQSVTFTATVSDTSAGSSGTPTGSVTFKDGTTTVGTASLSVGSASFSISTLGIGTHSITAVYIGDTNFATSTSSAVSQVVNPASTSTTVVTSLSPSVFGQSVTFTSTTSVTAPGVGTIPAGDTVTFKDGATTLGTVLTNASGVATFTTSTLSVATHSITAVYAGDTNFATSTSSAVSQVVTQASTTTTVASSVNPSSFGQSVTFTATVTAVAPSSGNPTGTVTFKDGSNTVGSGTLSTTAGVTTATFSTSSLSAGSHSINAVYAGDTNFQTSTSNAVSQVVNQDGSSISVTTSGSPSVFGQAVTFTATVIAAAPGSGTPSGTVTFKDGATVIGSGTLSATTPDTASASVSTLNVSGNPHSITAVYGGDTNFIGSTSSAISQSISQATSTTSVSVSPNSITLGQTTTVTATVSPQFTGTPTGSVTVSDGLGNMGDSCTIALVGGTGSCTLKPTSNGSPLTVTGTYSSDSNFKASSGTTSLTVVGTPPSITSTNSATFTAGIANSFTVTTSGTPTASLSFTGTLPTGVGFTANSNGTATISGTATVAGSYPITIKATNNVPPDASQSFTLTVVAGTPASIAVFSGSGQSTTVNMAFGNPLVALVADAFANPVSGASVTFAAPASRPSGNFSGNPSFTTTTDATGKASAAFTANTMAGTYNVTASTPGVTTPASFLLTNLPGPIATLALTPSNSSITAGDSQSYMAEGIDAFNNPVAEVTAQTTFTISPDGSCTGASCTANAADANGSSHMVLGTYSGTGAKGAATLTVTAGTFTKLQLLVPGETAAPGTATGKAGTPAIQYVNGKFNVTVNAVDQFFNVVSSVTDKVHFISNDTDPNTKLPQDTALVGGTGSFSVILQTVSYNPSKTTITVSDADVTDGSIASDTSPAIEVIVVYTAGIAPTMAAKGDAQTYTLTVNNAAAPNTNNLESVEVSVPSADQGSISSANVSAANGGPLNWTYDNSKLPGTLRFFANSGADAVTPGGNITITFTATSNAPVVSTSIPEEWTTVAFSDKDSNNPLPLAGPEPTVKIGKAPEITSGNTATFTYQTPGTPFTVTTTGVPLPTVSESGSLAPGLTFTDNSNGTATISGTPTAAGSYPITITAHSGFGPDATQILTIVVNKADSVSTVVSSVNPSVFGESVTFTATVSAISPATGTPTGTVQFMDGTTAIGAAQTLNNYGKASVSISTLSVASHSITAVYSGDNNFNKTGVGASNAMVFTQDVNKADSSGVTVSSLNPSTYGLSVTFTVTVSAVAPGSGTPTGSVQFYDGPNPLGSPVPLAGGQASYSSNMLNAGTHYIKAVYTGDGNFNGSTSNVVNQVVNKANATISVTPYSVTYDATAHVATGSAVGVFNEALSGLDLSGTTHTGAGTYYDTWTFTDSTGNYNNANGKVTDVIAKADPKVLVTGYDVTYDGSAHTATGSAMGVVGETLAGLDLSKTVHTNAGSYTDTWYFSDVTGNYNNASGTVTDVIEQATPVVTWNNPADIAYGTPLSGAQLNATFTFVINGSPFTVVGTAVYTPAAGTVLPVGSNQTLSVAFTSADPNYKNTTGTAQINVIKATPQIFWQNPADITYGTKLSATQLYALALAPTSALTGWFKGEGDVSDSSPTANQGTVVGSGTTFVTGEVGQAFSFDGTNNSGVTIPYNVGYDLNAPGFSASFWVNGSTNGNGTETLLDKSRGVSDNTGWSFDVNSSTGILTFSIGQGGTSPCCDQFTKVNSTVNILDGNFHYVTGSWDATASTMSLYVDGVLQATTPVAGAPANNTRGLNIGYSWGGGTPANFFAGLIDEVQIYDLPLPAGTYAYSPDFGTVLGAGKGQSLSVMFTPTDTANLNNANDSASINVNAEPLTITANSTSKSYGDTVTFTGKEFTTNGLVNGDTISSVTLTSAGASPSASVAGSPYDIVPSAAVFGTGSESNYKIAYVNGTLAVNKAHLTVKADDQMKTYDGAPFTSFTASFSGFVNGEDGSVVSGAPSFSGAAVGAVNAGTYMITPSAGTLTAVNYDFTTFLNGTLTINKRTATWTTNAASKTYGDADPTPLTTGSGNFLAADNVTATYTRAAGETVAGGPYHITATLSSTVPYALKNYIITNAGAEFTISARPATWTTNAASKTYGDADPIPLTTGSGSNFVAADGVTASYTRAAGETVAGGPYHITATLSSTVPYALKNYIITNAGAEFTISARPATWTTNAASKIYGDADPSPLTTGSGNFLAADNVTATYTRAAGETVAGGPYHITATLSSTVPYALKNYIITNAGAEFTISARPATWTTNAASKTYGDADPNPLTTGSGNFLAADGVTASYTRAPGETVAGPYHIMATLSSTVPYALNNYIVANTGADFTINRRNATWTTNSNNKTYGSPDPSPLTTGSGNFVAADGVTATYTRVAGETVTGGPYHITAMLAPAGVLNNYNITNMGASFGITPASLLITASSAATTYGVPVVVVPLYQGFVNTEGPTSLAPPPSCGPTFTVTTAAGTYPTTCMGASDPNYNISYAPSSVTVSPANTNTMVTSAPSTSNWMDVVTFKATVVNSSGTNQQPVGSVYLYNAVSGATCSAPLGSTTIGIGALTGTDNTVTYYLNTSTATIATPSLPTGTDTILACYNYNPADMSYTANFNASSGTTTQTVIPAPIVTLVPTSLSFGTQAAGTKSPVQSITICNGPSAGICAGVPTATAALSVSSIALGGNNPGDFIFTTSPASNCGGTIAVGGSCTVNVQFAPQGGSSGVESAFLNVTDNNANVTGSIQAASVSGAGLSTLGPVAGSFSTDAIFATNSNCSAVTISGNGTVDSYNGAGPNMGNVGTNGNVTLSGNPIINGTVYSPFGPTTGTCSSKGITGLSTSGKAQATGGVKMAAAQIYPLPPAPNPAPPTSTSNITSCPSGLTGCTNNGSKNVSLVPGQYGNITISGGTTAHVTSGTYNFNSLSLTGNSVLYVDSGPVVINLAGAGLSASGVAMDSSGGTIINPSGKTSNLQIYYAGSNGIKLSGGSGTYALVYAPNAGISVSGGSHFYGSIIANTVNSSGNTAIHGDLSLASIASGDTLWFSSSGLKVQGLPTNQTVKLYVTNASISFTANGSAYNNLPVPNAVITFSPTATSASTTWDAANNRWSTLVPTSSVNTNSTIHTFFDGVAFPVPTTFSNGIQNVSFQAAYSTTSTGLSFNWQWGAAVYSSFGDNSTLAVNPLDGTDPAGTPESYKSSLQFGDLGPGYVGMYQGSTSVVPTIAPASIAPSSNNFGTVSKAANPSGVTAVFTLTNNQSGTLTMGSSGNLISITGTNAADFSQTNTCPAAGSTLSGGGGSCTVTVTFTPSTTSVEKAKLSVYDSAPNSPQTVFLTGTGAP